MNACDGRDAFYRRCVPNKCCRTILGGRRQMSAPLYTRKQLAKALHLSVDGLDRLIHNPVNPLPRFRAGRKFLFRLDEVLDFLRDVPPPKRRARA